MANIAVLTDDAFLYILEYLDSDDRIAFAYTCRRFKEICVYGKVLRKVNLNRCEEKRQQNAIIEFFRDKQMAEYITELNFNNQHVMNWQTDFNLKEFILAFCPQLEALHVVSCGMSLKILHQILQRAHKLTALSWSLLDLTSHDIEFLEQQMQSSNAICFENVRNLHIEILGSRPHIQILEYLVLCCCKYLEELQIYIWKLHDACGFVTECNWNSLSFPYPSASVTDTLQQLHSLMIVAVGESSYSCSYKNFHIEAELSDFVFSVIRKKSRKTKWKKFWISQRIDSKRLWNMFNLAAHSDSLGQDYPNELHSLEAFTTHLDWMWGGKPGYINFFERMEDNSLKNLHLCANHCRLAYQPNLPLKFCDLILRSCRERLKYFSLSISSLPDSGYVVSGLGMNTLFSACHNITELGLLGCHFEKTICEALSKLKHLVKIQLMQCAIFPTRKKNQLQEPYANLQTFVENCQNIEEFGVHGCSQHYFVELLFCVVEDDLLALSKLTKLKSLLLYDISQIRHWNFLRKILEQCKFLKELRIKDTGYSARSFFPILESATFLKHLAIDMSEMDLGSQDCWKLLSCATNLERLCIKSQYMGSLNVAGAVEMLKRLPRLHVFHVHFFQLMDLKVEYFETFCTQVMKTLEEEKSNRISYFEFLLLEGGAVPLRCWTSKKVLPINIAELCFKIPSLPVPKF